MARWALHWLHTRNIAPGPMIDWGCGTGAAARIFAAAGWPAIGIDSSAAMLAQARAVPFAAPVQWIEGDMRAAHFVQKARLATAFYDTLNYLISDDDLRAAWRAIALNLALGGYAIVDVNTPYEYAIAWNGQWAVRADTADTLVINQLRYNARSGTARGRIIWFMREEGGEHWRRGSETHLQRAHTDMEMATAIEAAGMAVVERCTPQGSAPSATSTRIIYVARKCADFNS